MNTRRWNALRLNRRRTAQLLQYAAYAHHNAGSGRRTSKHGRDGAFRKAQAPARLVIFPVAQDEGNFAQKFACSQRRIGKRDRVALGLNARASTAAYRHHAMGHEPAAAAEKDDVALANLVMACWLNHQRIAGPHRG